MLPDDSLLICLQYISCFSKVSASQYPCDNSRAASDVAALASSQMAAFRKVSIVTGGWKNLPAQISNITSGSCWELGD